jgi:8-oxo-dGTP diphosphatase
MPKITAGCLVRAVFDGEIRFLIVHPSGNYNRGKPWSIPKGLLETGETPQQAALRETREEVGIDCRIIAPLGEVDYRKSRKKVIGFLAEPVSAPASTVLTDLEWEIDQAEFLPAAEARRRLHPDQQIFVDRALGHGAAPAR